MIQLTEGQPAPFFEGVTQNGENVSLDDFKGKKLILYFYPKDNTPGCTAEACDLRDNYNEMIKQGFAVAGISPDSQKSHSSFAEKYNLPFPLIADTDKKIATDYGVWTEKNMYGRKYFGIQRTTFIINEDGVIDNIVKKVKTKDHSNQIFSLYK